MSDNTKQSDGDQEIAVEIEVEDRDTIPGLILRPGMTVRVSPALRDALAAKGVLKQ